MAIPASPLSWPVGWPRTGASRRRRAQFGKTVQQYSADGQHSWSRKRELSITDGIERILVELGRLGIGRDDIVISTNLRLRPDGLPRGDQREPDDPGVAVYWTDTGMGNVPRCMAVDMYDRIADNLGAVAATIEAMRAIERHGGAQILNRAFAGFAALPAPMSAKPWREVLGAGPGEVSENLLEDLYRVARSKHHPDKGGTNEAFIAVRMAYDQARRDLGLRDG